MGFGNVENSKTESGTLVEALKLSGNFEPLQKKPG